MSIKQSDPRFARAYERATLRSAFVSMFWAVFTHRKRKDGLTLLALAKAIPANKAEVSRWFKGDPNWTINTIASIANALDVDVRIEAVDRKAGIVFTPAGLVATTTFASTQLAPPNAIPSTRPGFNEPPVRQMIDTPRPLALAS